MSHTASQTTVDADNTSASDAPPATFRPLTALCHGGDASSLVVQLRASVFDVPAAAIDRLDGGERIGAAAGCFLRGGLLPRKRDLHIFVLGAYWPNVSSLCLVEGAQIMRFRSIATLGLFGIAAVVALKYPLVRLGICISCLILYLRPEPPGVGSHLSRPEGGGMAPIYTVGIATFLVVLGLGLSPLPQDSGTLFLSRVWTVAVASLYTVGVASVLRALFLESIASSARNP
jgi:hypothetical protein